MQFPAKIRGKIILSVLFSLAVKAVLAIVGDLNQMLKVLSNFQWFDRTVTLPQTSGETVNTALDPVGSIR